ncbi:cyclase family protein [Octadecabacter arcticus]|nr:cyclase family protein [Octadecabacter arcticus]
MTIHEGMTTFPVYWHPVVEVTHLGRLGMEKRETKKIVLGTHTGTHMDAPRHFIPGGETVENIALDQLCGPALVLDCAHFPNKHEVTKSEIIALLKGRTPERIVFNYDWCKHLDSFEYYSEIPFLSEDAAKYLVEIGVRLVAMDTPMPDNPENGRGSENDSPNHYTFLSNGVIIVEYLINISEITREEIELFVLPLKIKDGDGAPVRCIAVER